MTAPESPQPVDAPDDDKSHVPPLTTRVVIAEDEALIRLDLKEMLEEEGYTVVGEAGDGEQAVELAREHKPDLVILDVKMPKLDGISAAEKIAEEGIAPVLMLTAFSQRDLVERARDAGAMAYLVKPFSKSDVVPAIEMAVSRFTELKQLEQEVADLTLRLETRKLVDRAKSILQTEYGLSEPRRSGGSRRRRWTVGCPCSRSPRRSSRTRTRRSPRRADTRDVTYDEARAPEAGGAGLVVEKQPEATGRRRLSPRRGTPSVPTRRAAGPGPCRRGRCCRPP